MGAVSLEIEIRPETSSVQQLFEAMLATYRGVSVIKQAGYVDTGNGLAQQEFYVKPNVFNQVPYMGAQLTDSQGRKGYELRVHPVYVAGSGAFIWKAENWLLRADNDGTHSTILGGLAEAYDLAYIYDLGVVQAASNHYRAPITSSQRVAIGSVAEGLWNKLGYIRTNPGGPYMEKVYRPENK